MNALKRLQIEYNGICGIIEDYTDDPIVSSDVIGTTCGALVDGALTDFVEVDGKKLYKVVAWYDNEMGYSSQMVRLATKL